MKVRLWRGPFNGKVIEHKLDSIIRMTGPKKLTREQRWKSFQESETYPHLYSYRNLTPRVSADYRMVVQTVSFTDANGVHFRTVPSQHPDGSYFYEYIKDSKKEW